MSSDDESIDELAGDGFLKGIPKRLGTAESLRNELNAEDVTRPTSKRSYHTAQEVPEHTLPPQSTRVNPLEPKLTVRQPLAKKTANLKTQAAKDSKRVSKPEISAPVSNQISGTKSVHAEALSTTKPRTFDPRQPSRSNRSELSRKIPDLLKEAAHQEAESERREAEYEQELAKPSPQQRAKAGVIKASRAVKEKLRSKKVLLTASVVQTQNSMVSPKIPFGFEGRSIRRRGTLDRRVAEGINLSNPKIQSLTGDSSVSRKPLPIYESMRSRMERSSIEEDPFQDGAESGPVTPLRSPDQRSLPESSPFNEADRGIENPPDVDLTPSTRSNRAPDTTLVSKRVRNFSPEISGLAQHSDTLIFSSSPEATSTPFSKWRSRPASLRNIRKAVSNRRKPKANLEGHHDASTNSTPPSQTITEGSRSVKRRSGNEDLRSPSTPVTKKARLSHPSQDEASVKLTTFISAMSTGEQSSQSPSSKIIRGKKARSPQGKKKKRGLGIFDVHIGKGKGKATYSPVDENKRPQLYNSHFSRPSFSRPHSIIFGRETKASDRGEFAKLPDHDDMDIDELA